VTISIKVRLSIMMFLQYFILGATVPIFSLYLTRYLQFSGFQTGAILSMSAVAAFVSPLAGAFVADRLINATRLYGLCHLIAGFLMAVLSYRSRFGAFLFIYLTYMLVFGPTLALSNAITFHHLPDSERSFGGIRMWGTIGWIAVAWLFGFFWLRSDGDVMTGRLPDALKLSAISSILLGLYAFTLPVRQVQSVKTRRIIPIESIRVMVHRDIVLLSVISFFVSFVNRFYYFGTGPFLRHIGFDESTIMPAMSLGQVPEVFAMGLLGLFHKRFGLKRVITFGILMELGRFSSFAIGTPTILVLAGISFHGIAFAFYHTSAFIYLDSHCDKNSRSGVHQLFAIITSGFGSFFGSLTAGKTLDMSTKANSGGINFWSYWAVPAGLSLFTLIIVMLFFKDREIEKTNRI
jgi:nucleoside transporter